MWSKIGVVRMNKQEIEKAIKLLKHHGATWKGKFPSPHFEACETAIKCMEKQLTNGWIPVSERLPNMEECQKNDCRFIVTDGNRVYEDSFDYMTDGYIEPHWTYSTMCQPTAWQPLPEPLPEPYKELATDNNVVTKSGKDNNALTIGDKIRESNVK
jgi:hypothetical protein